ncbi:MAG: HlyD family efflux transporter periplasmic adaptor subunit [Hyphomicrobium sp.]|uniref:HlyD family efflux transporter periplasmic adaptor subunit n=1 Tax=Hyphomicrobium sp. TaxID=82 RepID=UPI001321DCF8|nr:HlyD family efflux transporter periplasmic adaptor subunit [Hyphomicrobium sp.]KAB2937858.1 MAG: HlyD family efflux transporter periplasmic adaptor subunit [Hyphomicrobium sp.]MBZ0210071.1 HlyD family efflux transporter periplasmic adaptor subunit [Hyphomicrobium sp.]
MSSFLSNIHSVVSMRRVRIGLALLLIGVSVWAFAPYIAYRVSTSAFINAEMMRVTAPISGYLAQDIPHKGKFIDHPSRLTLIESYTADRRRLLELEGRQVLAKERAQVAKQQLADVTTLDGELEKRMQAYRDGMVKRLGHEINEAEAEKKGCLAEVGHRRDIGTRMQGLAESGTTSQIRSAEALAKQEETATRCEMAGARVERLKTELTALQAGVLLRDAANDVPYSQQQRERLFLRRQELETEAGQQSALASELAAEIAEERRRVESLGRFNVTLPPDHVVWSVPASPGSIVSEGQTVLDLADCDHRFVAVELPEREFENIKPSDPASVRLIGSNEWRRGYVRQVRGSAARADDRLLAAQVPAAARGNITVEVSLPDDGAHAANSSYCDIGRLADVRFQRRPPAFVESASRFFRSLVDMFRPTEKLARQ